MNVYGEETPKIEKPLIGRKELFENWTNKKENNWLFYGIQDILLKAGPINPENQMVERMKEYDRMKQWRAKKASEGGRSLSLWLDPETVSQLDDLHEHYGKSKGGRNKPIITRAIQHFHETVFNK